MLCPVLVNTNKGTQLYSTSDKMRDIGYISSGGKVSSLKARDKTGKEIIDKFSIKRN